MGSEHDFKRLTGATVYGSDGERLGQVVECRAQACLVARGAFFPRDQVIAYVDIDRVEGGAVHLSQPGRAYLERAEVGDDQDVAAEAEALDRPRLEGEEERAGLDRAHVEQGEERL